MSKLLRRHLKVFFYLKLFNLVKLKARVDKAKFTMAIPCISLFCLSEVSKTHLGPTYVSPSQDYFSSISGLM